MTFQSALSGLNSSAKNLDVIGNNVANANTVGFKSSRAVFADVFAASLSGVGGSNIGIGTKIAEVQQQFTQGNITVTNNPLDIAINGKGFFRFDNNGQTTFSRNGQLHVDANGYLVNSNNMQLTGYSVDANHNVVSSSLGPMQLSTADIDPLSTSSVAATLNLDSRSTAIVPAFNPANPASYTSSTSSAIYDSLGNSHAFTMFFIKTGNPGEWEVRANLDGGSIMDVDLGNGPGAAQTILFNSSGALVPPPVQTMPITGINLTINTGAVTPQTIQLDFGGTTQFGSDFGVTALSQDGYTSGRLVGFDVSEDGIIAGRYTNGQANTLGQIVLASFANNQGLRSIGDNQWEETSVSGAAIIGTPVSGSLGSLQSASVEDSNVDLTQELVSMITAQRGYQANAQTIKTQDQVMQTIVNLR